MTPPTPPDPRDPVDDYEPTWRSFAEWFAAARVDDDTVFFIERAGQGRRTWTVDQWRREVFSAAGRLSAADVRPGAQVAVLSRNDADTLALTFGAWVLGVRVHPLDVSNSVAALAEVIRSVHTDRIVAAGPSETHVTEVAARAGVPELALSTVAAVDTEPPVAAVDRPALCLPSSGTSGRSKGAVLTARNLIVNADAMRAAFAWDDRDRVFTVLPICHGNGLLIGSLMPWFAGASLVLADRFRAAEFWDIAAEEHATTASVVPTILDVLLDRDGAPSPPGFRDVISGSGPLSPATAREFERRFVPVRQLYGLSETTAVLTVTPRGRDCREFDVAPGTTAGPVLPHVEMAVLDRDGNSCPAGVRGEIVARGAVIMTRYEGLPGETDQALRAGWFHTGDEGAWLPDREGRAWYTVTGRLKDIIVRGGLSVSPVEIDAVVERHPAVREALAFGYPDRRYGQEIAVLVVPRAPVTEAEILAYCAEHLERGHRPRMVFFGAGIPRTHTGKAKRAAVAASLGGARSSAEAKEQGSRR